MNLISEQVGMAMDLGKTHDGFRIRDSKPTHDSYRTDKVLYH